MFIFLLGPANVLNGLSDLESNTKVEHKNDAKIVPAEAA